MAFVSSAIPNLIGGVSQQPPEIRALNCSTALTNTWSDVVTGLSTRPPAMFLGNIGAAPIPGSTVATHVINKPTGDYHVSIYDGSVKVVKTTATGTVTQTIIVEGGANAYLAGVTDAAANFGFVTVADTTFIYNRSKTVTKTVTAESGLSGITDGGVARLNPNRYGTAWVKQRGAGWNNYSVYYNGVLKGNKETDGQTASQIATAISTNLTTNGVTNALVAGSVISVTLAAEGDFITTKDDYGDQAMTGYNDYIEEFTDLPNIDKSGRLVLVKGAMDDEGDDYWVWYKQGRWEETYGWNSYEKPDDTTMPVILKDNKDGTFTLKYNTYPGRQIGDADSNPTPSFVGSTIRSMFLYKGRMCVLSDENFIASRISNFENFYRQTCTQLLDEDPIDIAAANSRGASANFAKEFAEGLLIFTAFDQFRISADSEGLLSPNTVTIKKVNSYNNSQDVEPSFIGPNVAFVDDYGTQGFASMREYQVDKTFGTEVALPITDAVPEYVPTGVYKVIGSSTYNNLMVVSKTDRSRLWLYNYYFNGEGKVQSSWQDWSYTGSVYSIDYSRDKLVVAVAYNGFLNLTQHIFDSGADTKLDKRSILLDMGCEETKVTRTLSGADTLVTLPFTPIPGDLSKFALVISPQNMGSAPKAQTYVPASLAGAVLTFKNVNLTNSQFVVGFRYDFSWTLSPIYLRDKNMVAIQDGRLQLRRISILYNYSGPFTTKFTPTARQTYTSTFSGFRVGASGDNLGTLSLESGEFRVAVNGAGELLNLVITGTTPWRVRFSTLEWDGSYRAKKRRT
ncbi:hypothetical protein [Mesorhizobium sp. M1252]|uniref:phage nozzle protein n=1 Tax=Mesorhizobium sp. M1252 TaxID=2957073 RepID=UPI003338F9E8